MDAVTLLAQAREAGIDVRASREQLHVRGPKRHEALVEALFEHKTELLELLRVESGGANSAPSVRPDIDVPDGVYVFENPRTGQQFFTVIYRCPACHGTNWGSQIDDDMTWHCLTCARRATLAAKEDIGDGAYDEGAI
jgi:hypothetical protein